MSDIGNVYVAQEDDTNMYKVGYSTDVDKRLYRMNHNTDNHRVYRLVYKVETQYPEVERRAHEKLKDKRIRKDREFFREPLDEIVSAVDEAKFEVYEEHEDTENFFRGMFPSDYKAVDLQGNELVQCSHRGCAKWRPCPHSMWEHFLCRDHNKPQNFRRCLPCHSVVTITVYDDCRTLVNICSEPLRSGEYRKPERCCDPRPVKKQYVTPEGHETDGCLLYPGFVCPRFRRTADTIKNIGSIV